MHTEYVYIAKRADGLHKIGCTGKLQNRIRTLNREHEGFEIVHTVETNNAVELESQFHRQFHAKRREGEWFDLSANDVISLLMVPRQDFPKDGDLLSNRSSCTFNLSADAQALIQDNAQRYGISRTAIIELAIREYQNRDEKIYKHEVAKAIQNFAKSVGITVTPVTPD